MEYYNYRAVGEAHNVDAYINKRLYELGYDGHPNPNYNVAIEWLSVRFGFGFLIEGSSPLYELSPPNAYFNFSVIKGPTGTPLKVLHDTIHETIRDGFEEEMINQFKKIKQ